MAANLKLCEPFQVVRLLAPLMCVAPPELYVSTPESYASAPELHVSALELNASACTAKQSDLLQRKNERQHAHAGTHALRQPCNTYHDFGA